MTNTNGIPTDEAEFTRRLTRLITEARDGGVSIYGSYTIRSRERSVQDYEVEVVPVANRDRQ